MFFIFKLGGLEEKIFKIFKILIHFYFIINLFNIEGTRENFL